MYHISQFWMLVSLVLLFSVISGSLEIHNDDSVLESDNIDLRTENLLLVSSEVKHISRHSQRSLSSLNAKTNIHSGSLSGVNLMMSRPSDPAAPSEHHNSITAGEQAQQDDDVDLVSEGFLSAEPRAKRPSANSRKLAEFIEAVDIDDQVRSENSQEPTSQPEADKLSRKESAMLDIFQKTLDSACRDNEDSNDCLQFKKDFEAMMNNENLSHVLPRGVSAYVRVKRDTQNSGNTSYNNIKEKNRNIIGCHDYHCFSGDFTNPEDNNEDIGLTPDYICHESLSYPTNVSRLTPAEKERIAKDVIEKLTDAFKDVPGFKDIVVDPDDITIENGKLNIPWDLRLNSSDYLFFNKKPSQIGDIVNASLQNVSRGFKDALTLYGQQPIDGFDYNDAVQQIIGMASDPCKSDPCKDYHGYGYCQSLSPREVVCHHKCNQANCRNNGVCQINALGDAVCQCTAFYKGKFCEYDDDDLDGGKIAGITLGSCAIAAAICAGLFWFICIYRRRKMKFSHYTDQEGSGSYSNASSKLYFIDRPTCSPTPLAIYQTMPQNHGSHHNRPSSA